MANEQVSVRFAADIATYVKNVQTAQATLEKYGLTADKTMMKQVQGQAKVVLAQGQVVASTAKVATETAKMEKAQAQAALAQKKLTDATTQTISAQSNLVSSMRQVMNQYLGIAAIMATVKKVFTEGMDFNKFVETSTAAFGVMMKSTDAAKAKMQELYDWAVKSPLTFKETVSASKQLLAYGFSAESLVATMQTLGTVSKATGHSLDDIAYIYGTLKTQGRAYTRDLMQFAMRGIPIYDELAKVLGVNKEKIQKMTEAGKVGFAEVQQAFMNMTTGSGVYAGFLEEYMKTFEGKASMLSDVWQKTTGAITSGITEKLKPIMDDLTASFTANENVWKTVGSVLGELLDIIYNLKDALLVIAALKIASGIYAISTSIVALNKLLVVTEALSTGIVTAISAIGGPVALAAIALTYLYNKFEGIQKFVNSLVTGDWLYGPRASPEADMEDTNLSHWKRTQRAKMESMAKDGASPAKVDEEAWEKALKAFEKYRDAYLTWLMSISDDPYAKLDYEYTKKVAELKKQLSGDQYNTALGYITLQYEYERAQITKTLEAQKQANMAAALDRQMTARERALAPYYETVEQGADYTNASMQRGFAEVELEKFTSAMKEINEGMRIADESDIEFNRQQIELWEKVLAFWKTQPDNKKSATVLGHNPKLADVGITRDEISAIYIKAFQTVVAGSSSLWSNIQEKAGVSFKSGNWMKGYGLSALARLQGTGVGNIAEGYAGRKEGGMGGGLNAFITAISAAAGPMKLLIKFIVDIVKQSEPITDLISAITSSVSGALMPVINSLAEGLAWLYDYVVVPIGNGIIDMVNALIRGINNTFGKWFGFKISEIDALKTTTEALQDLAAAAASTEALTDTIDYLQEKLDDLVDSQITSLQDLYEVGAISAQDYEAQSKAIYAQYGEQKNLVSIADKQLVSLGEIYTRLADLQAVKTAIEDSTLDDAQIASLLSAMGITGSITTSISQEVYNLLKQYGIDMVNYVTGSAATIDSYTSTITSLQAQVETQATTITSLQAQITTLQSQISAISTTTSVSENAEYYRVDKVDKVDRMATGTNYVPQDMIAQIHKGEKVIPADFSSAIDRGEITLGSGSSSGGNINVTVNVEGSVQTENKLAISIANAIYKQRRSGVLTV